jgi:hypothetical protein
MVLPSTCVADIFTTFIENVRIPFADLLSACIDIDLQFLVRKTSEIAIRSLCLHKLMVVHSGAQVEGSCLDIEYQNSANTHVNPATATTSAPTLTATSLPASPVILDWSWPRRLLVLLLVALEESRAVSSGPGEVVVAEVRPFGSSVGSATCCVVTTLLLSRDEDEGWENPRVSVTSEVADVGRGVVGAAIVVGIKRVAWLGFSMARVGVLAGTGVWRVVWSVPSVATVGVSSGTGVPRVACSVPSDAMVGMLASTGVVKVAWSVPSEATVGEGLSPWTSL